MATDSTSSETETCSSDSTTETKLDASMTPSIDLLKSESIDISDSESSAETSLKKSPLPDDGTTDENVPKFVVSDPIHIEVPHDDVNSEDIISKKDSKNALLDIHNIQILDEPPDKDESSKNDVSDTINISDGSSGAKSVEENDATNESVSNDSTIIINDEDVVSSNSGSNLKPNNVIVLNPKNNLADKQILNNDLLKGQRVFILNGNVSSKEEVEKTKPDNINIICVSNNLSDLITNIKNDTITAMTPGRSLLTPETADRSVVLKSIEKMINTHQTAVPTVNANCHKFIQITTSNYKQISPKINVSTAVSPLITVPKMIAPKPAPIANSSNEMLRTKLLENEVTSTSPAQTIDSSAAGKKPNSVSTMKKDNEVESPAIARARNEFNKCRKKLIEAAIHPQLPTYKPPMTYEGPIFSCEECDDTFSCIESLKNHKNRRSVLFTYNCPPCNCTLEFYNRCTFLLHVRSHDAAVKACYLTISTIPSDKLNFRLLQHDEVELEIPQQPEKPIARSKERVPMFKIADEPSDPTPRAEIKENGTDKSKTTSNSNEKSANAMRNFDFIKSLRKNKFEAYLQNTDRIKKFSDKKPIEKKFNSESSLSEDSSDNEDESVTSLEAFPNDTRSLNGTANTSQLKYFLTTNDRSLNSSLKRPTENNQPSIEETASKKLKVNQNLSEEPEPQAVVETPKTKHTPIIIRTKTTSPQKPDPVVDKTNDEITLTSSSDEEDSESEDNSEDNKSVVCRECRTEVINLNKHIRAENKPLKEFLCEHCKFFSPSQCALQAHIRMHSKTQPYICPDCGFYFNTFETFQTHVKQVCYYDYKAIRFECPECSLLKPSVQAFADHLKRCHTRDVFKCSLCITSSYSTKVVEIHMKKKHVGEEGSVLEGYRCMLCPNILISKKSIDTHINKHVFSLKHLRYVYICKRCKKYASGRRSKFVQHLNECDDKKKDTVVKPKEKEKEKEKTTPSKSVTTKTTSTNKPNRRSSKSPASKKDAMAVEEKDPLSVEDWEADKSKAQHVPKTKICVMCRSADISSRSHSLFCSTCVCSVNADDTESSEGRHESGRPKRKFKCRLCKQLMNKDWATITKHYEQDHPSDLDGRSESKSRQPKEVESKKSEKSDAVPAVNVVKKRRPSTKEVAPPAKSPKIEEIIIPPPPTPPPPSSGYKCVRCGFTTENREDFQTHIVSHKDPNNTQCPECGECFVVDATLAKHLLIRHEVRNLRKYFIENNLFKKEEIVESRKKTKENQCEVCLMQYDSKQSYDKHIRTHGMAFVALQSRAKDDRCPRG